MRFLSPKDAGAIMKRARNLLAADALSRSAFPRLRPCLPIRTVAEQLRLLGVA